MKELMSKGWYEDPYDHTQEIWWDGTKWHPDAKREIINTNYTSKHKIEKNITKHNCINCFVELDNSDVFCNKCGVRVNVISEERNERVIIENILPPAKYATKTEIIVLNSLILLIITMNLTGNFDKFPNVGVGVLFLYMFLIVLALRALVVDLELLNKFANNLTSYLKNKKIHIKTNAIA